MLHMDYGTMSHIKPLLEVGNVLRERNHTVVYAVAEQYVKFNKGYNFPVVSLGKSFDDMEHLEAQMTMYQASHQEPDAGRLLESLGRVFVESYKVIYPQLSKTVDQERPDVMICDFFSPACRDVALMKGIPLITGLQSIDGFGISPTPFITNSLVYGSITTDNLSFTQRFIDAIFVKGKMIYKFLPSTNEMNRVRKKFNVPSSSLPLGDFSTTLGIANTFVGFEPATNIPPNLRLIGPIRSNSFPSLTADLQLFLDTHPRTLYIGFGSLSILSTQEVTKILTAALLALGEGSIDGVIWGLGKTSLRAFPPALHLNHSELSREEILASSHIRILPWAPQTAILNHVNTRVFISHVGLESSHDAIFSATPVLCMPIFGDQPRNARKLVDAGIGRYIDRIHATPASIAGQINHIILDPQGTIAANLRRMKILAQSGSRRITFGADTIEEYAYTARICRPTQPHHPSEIPCEAKHLIPKSRGMTFIQANLIDIYLAALLLSATSLALVVYVARISFIHLLNRSHLARPKIKPQ
ncbi:hypothetical protein DSO57_1009904 [Entomophthora muscae]|uniref:Uncharacterized protein n=1 Tax=Entomophthora muscae TaxID=34485 RepID=A0ACC2U528_9FUNG|nr:hypothetical protein DSO57_1009904 [Entomophthora muscae]